MTWGQPLAAIAACVLAFALGHDHPFAQPVLCLVFVAASWVGSSAWVAGAAGEVYSVMSVFAVAGALILTPGAVGVLVVMPVAADAVRRRTGWRRGISNWSNFTLASFATHAAGHALPPFHALGFVPLCDACLAAGAFVVVNLGLLTLRMKISHGLGWNALPIMTWRLELVFGLIGAAAAQRYQAAPLAALVALAPLGLLKPLMRVPALEREARVDPKTMLFNMRYFMSRLENEVAAAVRASTPLSVLAIDIDHFREINNAYGHLVGDEMLRLVGDIIRAVTRRGDTAARFGGEEFFILMPGTSGGDGIHAAESLRDRIGAAAADAGVAMSVSVGVSSLPDEATDPIVLLKKADEALYAAKAAGRNRTFVYHAAGARAIAVAA